MEPYCRFACVDRGEPICQLPTVGETVGVRTRLALARAAEFGLGLMAAAGGYPSRGEVFGLAEGPQRNYDDMEDRVQRCIAVHRQPKNTINT